MMNFPFFDPRGVFSLPGCPVNFPLAAPFSFRCFDFSPSLKREVSQTSLQSNLKKKRLKTIHQENITISRNASFEFKMAGGYIGDIVNLTENLDGETDLSRHLRDRIADHAFRRIQLFYLSCFLYEGIGLTVHSQWRTDTQHGTGEGELQAAHSSLLTSIEDNFIEFFSSKLSQSQTIPEFEEAILRAIGLKDEDLSKLRQALCDLGPGEELNLKDVLPDLQEHLIGRYTYFYQANNSTVSLPSYVNDYDGVIEEEFRVFARELVSICSSGNVDEEWLLSNGVSKERIAELLSGNIGPKGLTHLLIERMQEFFAKSLGDTIKRREAFELLLESLDKMEAIENDPAGEGRERAYLEALQEALRAKEEGSKILKTLSFKNFLKRRLKALNERKTTFSKVNDPLSFDEKLSKLQVPIESDRTLIEEKIERLWNVEETIRLTSVNTCFPSELVFFPVICDQGIRMMTKEERFKLKLKMLENDPGIAQIIKEKTLGSS